MQGWIGKSLFVLVTTAALWLVVDHPSMLQSQGRPSATQDGELQMFSTTMQSGIQQLVVLEPETRSLAIYHVDPGQGGIQLKSVRDLRWDLRMEEFNASSPLPSELRRVQP